MMRYDNAIVLGTMLVPTIGHLALIKFAAEIADNVHVLIQGRSFEPVSIGTRRFAVGCDMLEYDNVNTYGWNDDSAPQNPDPAKEINPGDDVEFWNHWVNNIRSVVDVGPNDAIVASEEYGAVLARYLGCQFIPFDIDRTLYPVKGTDVREDIFGSWDQISPTFRVLYKHHFVMFGQESVGKTTLAASVACKLDHYRMTFVPEYARPYLEIPLVGPDVTEEKMRNIALGQMAYETLIDNDPDNSGGVFDTDIMSTIGYYRMFMGVKPGIPHYSVPTKTYILLPDDIPFEPDILRYGGDKRESSYQFWKDLLDEYMLHYVEVPRGLTEREREEFIIQLIIDQKDDMMSSIQSFVRD